MNGIDVMRPDAGESTGDACRLDLPTSHRVLDALRAHMNGQVETGSGTPQSVVAAVQQLPPPVRELHRAVLRGFRDHGEVVRDDLRSTAAAVGSTWTKR